MPDPLFMSVIIPVYNGAKYLRETLESACQQDYDAFEVIVIDDGSSDESAAIAKSFDKVKYHYQTNAGNANARNRGIDLSRGEVIALLDQDDLWLPEKLGVHANFLREHPDVFFTVGRTQYFLVPGITKPNWCKPSFLEGNHIDYMPSSIVIRRKAFDLIGKFNPQYKSGNDSDWVTRAKDHGLKAAVIDQVLVRRRVHETNQSSQVKLSQQELLQIMRDSVRRKKGQ